MKTAIRAVNSRSVAMENRGIGWLLNGYHMSFGFGRITPAVMRPPPRMSDFNTRAIGGSRSLHGDLMMNLFA